MDRAQSDHLRAYGLAYHSLKIGHPVVWLLYYRGGAFLLRADQRLQKKAMELGVVTQTVPDDFLARLEPRIASGEIGQVRLERAPKIAVYVPPHHLPWDDAVTLALEYTQIPYDRVWDEEILQGKLKDYDWLHSHHEDFTGQFGRFILGFGGSDWYRGQVGELTALAGKLGFRRVADLKLAVARKIRAYVEGGGLLFAMCSAPDSLDVALAAGGLDIVPPEIDGTPVSPGANRALDFSKTFAFGPFTVFLDLRTRRISTIDLSPPEGNYQNPGEFFNLTAFSPLKDPVPAMLVQNHTHRVPDFLGLTSAFHTDTIKPGTLVLGQVPKTPKVKYIHGVRGKGAFTFLAGHDPEDYAHLVGESPTELQYHPHSPGYRLILNNVLYPAARKKELKT